MLSPLLDAGRALLIQPCCPLCHQPVESDSAHPCRACQAYFMFPDRCLEGDTPLPWQALGSYGGAFRGLLLSLRRSADQRRLQILIRLLAERCRLSKDACLVPIPSWKQASDNTLPYQIASGLQRRCLPMLKRIRPGVGQHRLTRRQRLSNLEGAFVGKPALDRAMHRREVWLVDDILTTGGTSLAAREALQQAGYRVSGVICLARTPMPCRDLGSSRRQGDTPG